MATRATTVGAVALDFTVDTNNLVRDINSAARNAGAQFASAFQQSLSGVTQSVNQLANNVQSSMNRMSHDMTSALRNSVSQLSSDMQTQMTQMSNSVANAVQNSSQQVAQGLSSNSRSLSQSMGNAVNGVRELENTTRDTANSLKTNLTSAIKSVGKAIIGAFAIKQVVSFTKSCVEAAAQVKALNAQLEQTFNTLQTDAVNAIKKVAQESGILETRLQGVGTQIYAFAKASGMDSVTALNMMQEALQVTADSAAYYDRSIEDTAESLRSFLKGNFANDAALGISCTETTRNIAANKLYGKSYRELSEAQKQLTLLQMVKDANKLSGAMGQAAREADGWENVTGNLKEAWKQFKAAIGQPLLQALIPIIKDITSALQKLTETAQAAAQVMSELFGWDLSSAQSTGEAITAIADDISEAEDEAQEEIKETEKAQGSLADFDNLNVLSLDKNKSGDKEKNDEVKKTADAAKAAVNDLNKAVDNTNVGGFIEKIQGIIDAYKPIIDSVKNYSTEVAKTGKDTVKKYLDEYGGTVSSYSNKIRTHLTNTTTQTTNGISNIINEAANSQNRMSDQLSSGYADLLGGASVFSFSFANVFTDMFDISSRNFEQWTIDNSGLLGDFFDGINLNIANFSTTFGGILEDMGTSVDTWWEESGAQAFDNVSKAFLDVQTVALDLWTKYISPFVDYITESCGTLWDEHLSPLWDQILNFSSSLMDALSAIWNGLLRPVYDTFVTRIMPSVMSALKSLWDLLMDAVGAVMDVLSGLFRSLQGLLDFITGIFTGDLEKAVTGFAEFVQGICMAIWGVIKGVLNIIIDALNFLWSALYGVLKAIIDGIGDLVGLIGDLFGQNWYFSMPEEPPRIPRLANGGLVRAPTIAMVGDNKNAHNDPEVISPLSKLQGMIDDNNSVDTEVLQQILYYLKMVYDECKNMGDINLTEEIDGDVFFKAMISRNNKYKNRHGGKGAFA